MHENMSTWFTLYDQLPPIIRWALGILSLGLITLTRHLWRRQQERLNAIERAQNTFATKSDIQELKISVDNVQGIVGGVHQRVDDLYKLLLAGNPQEPINKR